MIRRLIFVPNSLPYKIRSSKQQQHSVKKIIQNSTTNLNNLPCCSYYCTATSSRPETKTKAPPVEETQPEPDDSTTYHHSTKHSIKQEEESKKIRDTVNEKAQPNVGEKFDIQNEDGARKRKSLWSRLVAKIQNKVEDEITAEVPSQYKHPILKGLVVNQIDPAMLVYPEYDETSDVSEANGFAEQIKKIIITKLDSAECDKNKRLPDSVIKDLKELGVFGLQIPKKYGGLGGNNKFMVRCHEELSRDWSLYTLLNGHDLAAKAIELFGTERQKQEYLPRLASGISTGAFCLHEDCCGQDVASMESSVANDEADASGGYLLNGRKSWVTNGVNADIFVVFAKYKRGDDPKLLPSTAFIVDRKKAEGITDVDRKDTIGLTGVNISSVNFDKVKLPANSLLGGEDCGLDVVLKTQAATRFAFAAASASFLKRSLAEVVRHCNATKRWGVMLSDSNTTRNRIATVGRNIYALESAAYYIAGWLDDDPRKDFSLESAAMVRYTRRVLKESLLNMMELMGAQSRTTEMHFEKGLRDVLTLSANLSTDDVYSAFVSLETFKVFAAEHSTTLYQAKNVLHFPYVYLKDKARRQELYSGNIKLQHYINEHVHPSLETSCVTIEDAMAKFEQVFKSVVYSTGKLVEDETIVLERVTDILTNLFVMLATTSRASRSYCIGLKNADMEILTADTLCIDLRLKTLHLLSELIDIDAPNTLDLGVKEMGKHILDYRGYPLERPTTRNW